MKALEFLIEADIPLSPDELEIFNSYKIPSELLKTLYGIKRECQPFLNEVDDPFNLFRGLRATSDWGVKKTVRLDNRTPMSMKQSIHNELNNKFTHYFGEPFRNAVFCTGSKSQATVYGMLFCVYPIGEYKYLWSSDYRDLYHAHDEYKYANGQDPTFFADRLDYESYHTDRLNDGIYSGNEIMIRTKEYYALNLNNIHNQGLNDPGIVLNGIQEYFMI